MFGDFATLGLDANQPLLESAECALALAFAMPMLQHANRISFNRRDIAMGALSLSAPLTMASPRSPDEIIGSVLRDYARAWLAGDSAALLAAYHDDFTLIYPGRHALAGVHRGKQEALRVLQEVSRRTQRQPLEISDILVGANEGALHVVELWRQDAREARVERLLLYAVRDGQLFQCRLCDFDQDLVDEFLG